MYGNEGPISSFLNIAHNSVRKACNCFSMTVIGDVMKTNSYINKRFYFLETCNTFSAILF